MANHDERQRGAVRCIRWFAGVENGRDYMAKRKQWPGPFQYKTDGTCVKCDKRQEYFINVSGITLGACRKHAIEAACSREGGKTLAEATLELDEIDRERWRQRNRFTASWVPVTERLPEPDYMGNAVGVLTCLPDGEVCIGFCDNDEYGVRWQCNSTQKPTHWMPLPAPPADGKQTANQCFSGT